MRGEVRSHQEDVIPADSSSSVSSPRSNSSPEDDILEVSGSEFIPKPIYNFSIPDIIKHDHRGEQQEIANRLENSNEEVIPLRRKRKFASRQAREYGASDNQVNERSRNIRKRHKRNVSAATRDIVEDDDDDCHRPPVIDLTEIDSHDEYSSDTEFAQARALSHVPVITDLESFHRQLQDSRGARRLFRSPSVQRLHRLRRLSSRIAVDGNQTDNNGPSTPEPINVVTGELTSADDSVVVVDEVRRPFQVEYDEDHSIAMRMTTDAAYSPPYHTPRYDPSQHGRRMRHMRDDESFIEFRDRIRSIHRRSRERLEQARQISLEAHERLARIHQSIDNLRRGSSTSPLYENTLTSTNSVNENDSSGMQDIHRENGADDVEIIHEWNPSNLDSPFESNTRNRNNVPSSIFHLMPSLDRETLPENLPDFLRPLMSSFLVPPRLHHIEFNEDYEVLLNLAERIGPAKPRGLNKAEIDLIPSFRFSSMTAKETNAKCVICIGDYANREKLRRLPCTHDFHSKCIDKWLKSNKTCPICRNEVNPTAH